MQRKQFGDSGFLARKIERHLRLFNVQESGFIASGGDIFRRQSISQPNFTVERTNTGFGSDDLYTELWRACVGPLVDIPRYRERIFYFPQGHMEQLEVSTNQELSQRIPLFNLPSKIFGHVVHIQLLAKQDTDKVYAQITLHPEQDQMWRMSDLIYKPEDKILTELEKFKLDILSSPKS